MAFGLEFRWEVQGEELPELRTAASRFREERERERMSLWCVPEVDGGGFLCQSASFSFSSSSASTPASSRNTDVTHYVTSLTHTKCTSF